MGVLCSSALFEGVGGIAREFVHKDGYSVGRQVYGYSVGRQVYCIPQLRGPCKSVILKTWLKMRSTWEVGREDSF